MALDVRPYARILVALDGSDLAEAILPDVIALARAFGSRITLLDASTPAETIATEEASGGMPPVILPGSDPTGLAAAERKDAETYLTTVARRLSDQGLTVDWQQPVDAPAAAIVDLAARLGADLIAMTTHGRGGLKRAILGSVADNVIRHATVPILLRRVVASE